jgi:autotransporter-associated beta strand protein
MKSFTAFSRILAIISVVVLGPAGLQNTLGSTFLKNSSTGNLNQNSEWTPNTGQPGSSDVAQWSTGSAISSLTLGNNLTWGEIQVLSPSGTVTISSDGNTLTLKGISGTGIDMSAATANLVLDNNISISSAQSWNVKSGQSLTLGGTVELNGNNLTVQYLSGSGNINGNNGNNTVSPVLTINSAANTTYSGVIADEGKNTTLKLANSGTGTLTLSGVNTYTGGTTLSGGGTLKLGIDGALPSSGLTFAGGTLNANGHADSLGALTMSASSTITLLASDTGHNLTFSSLTTSPSPTGTLTVNNWTSSGDEIFIGSTAAYSDSQLAFFKFGSVTGGHQLSNGEIVPVPEPSTILAGCFVIGLLGWTERRRIRQVGALLFSAK